MVELTSSQFRVLVGIDGSDEALRGLTYASKLGLGVRASIDLLFVQPADQGLRSGGLQVRVVRENLLNSGLDLPGILFLKKGRDLLVELGHISEEWQESFSHNDLVGDPLGNHTIHYKSLRGRSITLISLYAPTPPQFPAFLPCKKNTNMTSSLLVPLVNVVP